jgi:hypothetical protein
MLVRRSCHIGRLRERDLPNGRLAEMAQVECAGSRRRSACDDALNPAALQTY